MWVRPLLAALLLVGCAAPAPDADPAPAPRPPLAIASDAFVDGGAIPVRHACDGDDVSPALRVSGAPVDATTLALIVGDPDAPFPQAPQRNFTHWLAWNVPLVDGAAQFAEGRAPEGAREGLNDGGSRGYLGPCPPPLSPPHRYVFTAYAVNGALDLAAGADRPALEEALEGRVLASATLVGTYARAFAVPMASLTAR